MSLMLLRAGPHSLFSTPPSRRHWFVGILP